MNMYPKDPEFAFKFVCVFLAVIWVLVLLAMIGRMIYDFVK